MKKASLCRRKSLRNYLREWGKLMSEIVDVAYKFGAGRYFQGGNVLEKHLGEEVAKIGKKAYIIGGPTALSLAQERISRSLETAGIPCLVKEYSGYCCYSEAEKVRVEAAATGCDVIIGVGGGRIMDFAKLCGAQADLPVVTVPTSMATCAAYTTLSVLYDETGKTVGNFYLRKEVAAVFIDAALMSSQPVRLAAAGVMDALAKFIEIKNGHAEVKSDSFDIDLLTAAVLAEHTYDQILELMPTALEGLRLGVYTEALRKLIFLCIPVTGIISGISKGFGQSAIGHELYYQLRTNFTKEALSYLHGEVVAIGLLAQLHYNGTPEQVDAFKKKMQDMGMPVSLSEIGIEASEANFALLYENMCASPFVGDSEEKRALFSEALERIL